MPMRIFTLTKVVYLITILMCSAISSSAISIVSVKNGNWSDVTIWSPQQIPTYSDQVTIKTEHTVIVDMNATCSKLIVGESNGKNTDLIIAVGKFLNVMGEVNLYGNNDSSNPTIFDVGDGTLNVGGDFVFYASPGYANLEIGTGTINIVGDLNFNASGQGNIRRRTVANEGTINLGGEKLGSGYIEGNQPIEGNTSLPNDYYRSQKDGNWTVPGSWLTSRDGSTNWETAKFSPTGSARRIEIMSSHTIYLSTNSPAANLIVYGTLECKQFIINGPGPFRLESGATLITSNSLGISSSATAGSIQVDGTRFYSENANYTYETAVIQETGDGLPATLNGNLTINNTAPTPLTTLSRPTLSTKLVLVANGTFASNGNLTLQSTASKYAQIGSLTGNAEVTGDVNVQSFITGGLVAANRGNRMISSPVNDDKVPTIYQQLKAEIVITGPGGPDNGFDSGGGNPNAMTLSNYSEPGGTLNSFIPVPNLGETSRMKPGIATFLYFRGNRANATGNKVNGPNYAVPENVTANYRGTINQGDIKVPIIRSLNANDSHNGINAVGNPYPAAISWSSILSSSNNSIDSNKIEDELRFLLPGGGFVTRTPVGVVPASYQTTAIFIQPGQGFYIRKANPGSGVLKFSESNKAVNNAAARLLTVPSANLLASSPEGRLQIRDIVQKNKQLRVRIEQNDLADEALVAFNQDYSPIFDNNDAIYFAGNSVMVGSITADNKVTSINAMPDVIDIQELKLYVGANASGAAQLKFTDLSVGEGCEIFLKDALFPDMLLNLKMQASYEFEIDRANTSTFGINRFSIIFKPELVEGPVVFTAKRAKANVELNWTSEVAPKVTYFEVEVSTDNSAFKSIGQVINAGREANLSYSFVDKTPVTSVRFYRLKQFNVNGSITYSERRMIDFSALGSGLITSVNVYPNPATDRIQVEFSEKPQSEIQATIFNAEGRKMKGTTFSANENIAFEVGQFPQGIYLLELVSPADRKVIGHSKFIVR